MGKRESSSRHHSVRLDTMNAFKRISTSESSQDEKEVPSNLSVLDTPEAGRCSKRRTSLPTLSLNRGQLWQVCVSPISSSSSLLVQHLLTGLAVKDIVPTVDFLSNHPLLPHSQLGDPGVHARDPCVQQCRT